MDAVERRRRVEKVPQLVPVFAAPSTTDSRCPSVPTTRKTESRSSSLTTSVPYRVDSVETQHNALVSAVSTAEERIWPRKLSSPSGVCGKLFGSTQGNT